MISLKSIFVLLALVSFACAEDKNIFEKFADKVAETGQNIVKFFSGGGKGANPTESPTQAPTPTPAEPVTTKSYASDYYKPPTPYASRYSSNNKGYSGYMDYYY